MRCCVWDNLNDQLGSLNYDDDDDDDMFSKNNLFDKFDFLLIKITVHLMCHSLCIICNMYFHKFVGVFFSVCTQLLVSRPDEENISCYLQLIEKCLTHEVRGNNELNVKIKEKL